MNFLQEAQLPSPRDEKGVLAFSRLAANRFGFFVYGVVYGFLSLSFGAFLGVFAVKVIFADYDAHEPWMQHLMSVLLWGTFILSWLPFGRWVQKRVRSTKLLFREGVLLEGEIINPQRRIVRRSPFTLATLIFPFESKTITASISFGGHPPEILQVGAQCPILYHPEVEHCYSLLAPQRPIAAKIQQGHS